MRMRAKRNRDTRFAKVQQYFAELDTEGYIKTDNKPLYLEIGCGKGTFCCNMAGRCTDAQFLAIEVVQDVMLMAMEKAFELGVPNLKFLSINADSIDKCIKPRTVDRLYLNFSDPWPRKKHAKRRLTSPLFLERYKQILKDGGKIIFKTDNRGLFDYSLETLAQCGFRIEKVLFDLHGSELDDTNIRTEYENNFSAKGFKINYVEAYFDAK